MSRLEGIEEIVLGPLAGRTESDWQRAQPGRWTPAQIVEHLALAFEFSARGIEAHRGHAPMTPATATPYQWLSRLLVFGWGWIPTGVARSPRVARPAERVSSAVAEARFREGLTRWRTLERELLPVRPHDLIVRHPLLGDLDVDQWIRLHAWHCRHHARQIRSRLGE